ncbi:MAG: hypothetical protein NTV46_19015, partial [Verrucomicrobia bacterium]|nr:hypothetical protein [Verrucomicrobiota bacterium]
MTLLPADGTYLVHIGDTARHAGEEYGYRLRISAPRPDFELRVVPSSVSIPLKSSATVSIYAVRKDGFTGPIQLALKDPPADVTAAPVVIPANQTLAKLTIKGGATPMDAPVRLAVTGSALLGTQETVRDAVPAEDRMQAFLWRHLVPASDLLALVFDPKYQAPPKRVPPARPPQLMGPPASAATPPPVATTPTPGTTNNPANKSPAAAKPKFTQQQIAGRLRQLKLLYEEGLLTD